MKDVIGILVCNSQKVLDHKLKDGKKSEHRYCYWGMSRFPQRILQYVFPETTGAVSEAARAPGFGWYHNYNDIDFPEDLEVRLYFAVKGQVLGYFISKAMGEQDGKQELRFHSESWTPIKPVTIKPSQGFRYFKHGLD
jgi:hypothetical protein